MDVWLLIFMEVDLVIFSLEQFSIDIQNIVFDVVGQETLGKMLTSKEIFGLK